MEKRSNGDSSRAGKVKSPTRKYGVWATPLDVRATAQMWPDAAASGLGSLVKVVNKLLQGVYLACDRLWACNGESLQVREPIVAEPFLKMSS